MNGWTSRTQVRDEAARRCLEWNKIKKKKKKNEVGRRSEGGGGGGGGFLLSQASHAGRQSPSPTLFSSSWPPPLAGCPAVVPAG